MADFYNRKTGAYLHSFNSSVFATGRVPQMRDKRDEDGKVVLDVQGNAEREMEPTGEATGPVIMRTGTVKVDREDVVIADLMMNPDKLEVWKTSRNEADRGVPVPYWKPATDGSNKIVEMMDAEKAVVDRKRDIKGGKTEFNGEYYAFVDQQRIDLIACHTIRKETVAKYPMNIKSSDGESILIPDVGTLESLFNKVFGLTVSV